MYFIKQEYFPFDLFLGHWNIKIRRFMWNNSFPSIFPVKIISCFESYNISLNGFYFNLILC